MKPTFRTLDAEWTKQVRDLWAYCFREGEAADDWFFANRYRPENVIGIALGEELLACLHMVPYDVVVHGRPLRAAYIVGVGVAAHARGMGLSPMLLDEALRTMRARGIALSPLYPFDYGFYRRYGWEIATSRLRCQLPLDKLGRFRRDPAIVLRPIERARYGELADAYAAHMRPYTGYIARNASFFAAKLGEMRALGNVGIAAYRGDACVGYAIYAQGGEIAVDELVYADLSAARSLLAALGGHASTASSIGFSVPPDSLLFHDLPDARGCAYLEPHAMMRIVDIAAYARAASLPSHEGFLRVRDEHAPWNDGTWDLSSWSRLGDRDIAVDGPVASVDIATLSAILYGYITVESAMANGSLVYTGADAPREVRIGDRIPYMIDVS